MSRILFGSLLFGAALAAIRFFTLKGVHLKNEVGAVGFDFSTGFASTAMLAAALLGTIISAGVLPDVTEHLSKDGYAALNVIFGALIAVATLVYAAVQKQSVEDGETRLHGYVGWFLIASAMIGWAAAGELATLWFLVEDLDATKGFTELGVDMVKTVLAIGGVATLVYLFRRMRQIIEKQPVAAGVVAAPAPEAEPGVEAAPHVMVAPRARAAQTVGAPRRTERWSL